MNIKKFLCSLLTVTTTLLGFQGLVVPTAFAAVPNCASTPNSDQCTTVKVGSQSVSYPKMQWTLVTQDAAAAANSLLTAADTSSRDLNEVTGNTSAMALGMKAALVPAASSAFSSNVPLVVGRYEPMSKTLHVDIFKIERLMVNGKPVNALYQSTFTPAYGDYWKASGVYLSVDQRRQASAVGPNPFTAFARAGSDDFNEISMKGAMVVLGHAQRYVSSPISVLVNNVPSTDQYTRKSGGLFRKKVTTYVDYYVTPEYYIGAPAGMQANVGMDASFCANDPASPTCETYQIANSGVKFTKLDGGNVVTDKLMMYQWSHSQSGWTLLAVFVIAALASFVFAAAAPLLATSPAGVAGLAELAGTAMGDSLLYTTVAGAQGGGGSGMYGFSGFVAKPEVAASPVGDLGHESAYAYKDIILGAGTDVNGNRANRIGGLIENTLPAVQAVLIGKCASNQLLKNCTAESGIVPRADQYTTFNSVEFYRDNNPPQRAGY